MPSVTITFSAAQAVRIQDALTVSLALLDEEGLPRPATTAALKDMIIADLQLIVRQVEREQAPAAIVDTPDINLT